MITTRIDYVALERLAGPKSELKEIIVPQILLRYLTDPIGYANYVNTLQVLNISLEQLQELNQTPPDKRSAIFGKLQPDSQLTQDERTKMIERSPKLMVALEDGNPVEGEKTEKQTKLYIYFNRASR